MVYCYFICITFWEGQLSLYILHEALAQCKSSSGYAVLASPRVCRGENVS